MPLEELFSMALKEGLFAALFIFTFIYFLREAKNREENLRNMYTQLSPQIDKVLVKVRALEGKTDAIEDVSKDIAEIKLMISLIDSAVRERIDK